MRWVPGLVLLAGSIWGCGEPSTGPRTGRLSLNVVREETVTAVDSWNVTISGPGGTQSRTGSPGGTIEFTALQPGGYSVALVGREGQDTTSLGQTSVTVVAGQTANATVSVAPVTPQVWVFATDANAGEAGPDAGTFSISRNGSMSSTLVVNVTRGGTAVLADDYGLTTSASQITFAPGQRTITIGLTPVLDTLTEGSETMILGITGGSGYTVGTPANATITITDAPVVSVRTTDAQAYEVGPDVGTFEIRRTGPTTSALAVSVTTAGTALSGTDYQPIATPVTIAAGSATALVNVTPVLDAVTEGSETVLLTVVPNAALYALSLPPVASVTIDDSPTPTVTVTAVDGDASEFGQNTGTFRIARSGPTTSALSVNVIRGGTAVNGVDYESIATTQTIPAGASFVDVIVRPISDLIAEQTETVVLTVTTGTGYVVGVPASATVTLTDGPVTPIGNSLFVGFQHTCGTSTNGQTYCWGWNGVNSLGNGSSTDASVPGPVTGGQAFTSLSTGFGYQTCALTAQGVAYCWGYNFEGQIGDGTQNYQAAPTRVSGSLTFVALATGRFSTCGLTNGGAAFCWGDNFQGRLGDGSTTSRLVPAAVAGGLTFVSVTVGGTHACALTNAGAVYCWGSNGSGQLGDGTFSSGSLTPKRVVSSQIFVAVTAGSDHTCALANGGLAYCWGAGYNGARGDGTLSAANTPTAVGGGRAYTMITAGEQSTCALTSTGTAFCWGRNTSGQLGEGTAVQRTVPVAVASAQQFASIAAGWSHTCGLTRSGALQCWGLNGNGQLGDGSESRRKTPAVVSGGRAFTAIAGGAEHTCGLTSTATYCWGLDDLGQLGDGLNSTSTTPSLVSGGRVFSSIGGGRFHSCGITTAGSAFCWGYNPVGALGNGSFVGSSVPVAVAGGQTFASIEGGTYHTCALTGAGVPYCWGDNGQGQVGDGSLTTRSVPTLVAGGRTFASLAVGADHACGLTSANDAYCWGYNGNGQLGDGSFVSRNAPTLVGGGIKFSRLAAGSGNTCGLSTTGVPYCWGALYSTQPAAISGAPALATLTAKGLHACGLTSGGVAYCWGVNGEGELGDGTTQFRNSATQIGGSLRFTRLAAGENHTCGIETSGTTYCWGTDRYGQLGIGRPIGVPAGLVAGIVFRVP